MELIWDLTLANVFLCFQKQIWLNECADEFKPAYYRRYVDDILDLFSLPSYLEKYKNFLNSKHRKISSAVRKNRITPFLF